jgi:hypothetical protein
LNREILPMQQTPGAFGTGLRERSSCGWATNTPRGADTATEAVLPQESAWSITLEAGAWPARRPRSSQFQPCSEALSRAKWPYTTVLNSAREPNLDRQTPLPFHCVPRHALPIGTAMWGFAAQLLVCWRVTVVPSPSFTADPTRGNAGQGAVNCVGMGRRYGARGPPGACTSIS